jgi:predicted Zn-dependent peptidase
VDFNVYWPPQQFLHQLELFEREENEPAVRLRNARLEAIFGNHVYGRHASIEQVREVTATDVYWWSDEVRRPENGVLIFVGDTSPDELFRLAEARFGDFGSEKASATSVVKPPPPPRLRVHSRPEVLFRHQPDVTQAFAVFSCSLPHVDANTYAAARVFEQLVEDQLWRSLRERAQVSYSVSPNLAVYRGGMAVLSVAADIDYDRLMPAMASFKKVATINGPSLVDTGSLAKAKVGLVRQSNWRSSSTHEIADQLLMAWNLGWPVDAVVGVGSRGLGVSAEPIATLEEACRKSVVITFRGDEPRLRAAWAGP